MEIITGTTKEFLLHLGFQETAGFLEYKDIRIKLADLFRPKGGVLDAIIESLKNNG